MYSKFNYTPGTAFYTSELNRHVQTGRDMYNEFKEQSQKALKQFIHENGKIDGTALKEHWFPVGNADVFLSHSHKDDEKVKGFAGWLYNTFGLISFIDSCSWGYCDDLLKDIDDIYCINKTSNTYNYDLRNYTTTHVHMMLSTALTEMIDNCECVIFYNTPNSITLSTELDNVKHSRKETLSPWIYHELSMTSMLRQQPLQRQRAILKHADGMLFECRNQLEIGYNIDEYLQNMHILRDVQLGEWKKSSTRKGAISLDTLYAIVHK